jgi:NTP pyrophosphatase (non-canonical NTP hydrolase)
LQALSVTRCARWHGPGTVPWSGADWSNAMCGEAGEAANIVKKLRRIETGTGAQGQLARDDLVRMLAPELADVVCYAVLVADHYGIALGAAVVEKFNAVSEREGFPERLPEPIRAEAERAQYCQDCGAQVKGAHAWGHDDNCPKRLATGDQPPDDLHLKPTNTDIYDVLRDIIGNPMRLRFAEDGAPMIVIGDQIVDHYGRDEIDAACERLGVLWAPGGPGPEGSPTRKDQP